MAFTVWYPTTGMSRGSENSITYPYGIKMFGAQGKMVLAAFEGLARRNAPYNLLEGPYPLVLLSTGFGIVSKSYGWLAEHIDEQVNPGGAFEGLIDTEHLAVIGHSFGGYTALALGGAQLDTRGLDVVRRTASATNDPILFLCNALVPHLSDMADLAGLETVPQDLWPAWSDLRVDAVVSMAGDAVMFGQSGLAEITVPVMAIGGTGDRDSPFAWGTHLTYENVSSPRKVEIALNDAGHFIFTGACDVLRRFIKFVPNSFCSDPAWDRSTAHLYIRHFVTAFLSAEVKQDAMAAAALTPDVQFSDMTIRTQGC